MFSDCLFRLRDGNGDRDGGAHHRVVAHTDETHHLDVRQEPIFAIIFTYASIRYTEVFRPSVFILNCAILLYIVTRRCGNC